MKWENRGSELEIIGAKMKQKKTIIFYGVDEQTIEIFRKVEFLRCNVIFCDGNLAGQSIGSSIIYTLDEILPKLLQKESFLVITTDDREEQILLKKKLILKELKENEDFFEAGVFERVYLPLWAYYSYGKCYVNFINHIPNYTCTLKCKNCSASIPYLKQKNPDVEQMKREIDLFFSKVDFCYTYDCTGGETFIVSDQLVEVLSYLLQFYGDRIGKIAITTNATVIPTDNMLRFLAEHKDMLDINISEYQTVSGWKEKCDAFIDTLNAWKIPANLVKASSWIDFGFRETTLRKDNQEMEAYFDECGNFCRAYINGKLYYCGHGHWANSAFYSKEGLDDDEAINFRDENLTKSMILEYNLGYVPNGFLRICRHCKGWGTRNKCHIPVAEQIEDNRVKVREV